MVRSFEAFRLHPRKPESGLERHQNVACSHDGARRWNVPSLAPPSFMLAALFFSSCRSGELRPRMGRRLLKERQRSPALRVGT